MRRAAPLLMVILTGCLSGSPSESPASSAATESPAASTSVAPSTSVGPVSPGPTPTPGEDAIPIFLAGDQVASTADGLRIRSRPGTDQLVLLAFLPVGSQMIVELGPVIVDGHGWYLLKDADDDDPAFDEGWVAAGFEPEPFLVPALFDVPFNPILGGFAHDASGEYGPVRVQDANVAVRWVAARTAGREGCSFAVDLVPGSGTPVPAIRATIGGVVSPGDLYASFFAEHPELTGDIFVRVTSDCTWALSFVSTAPIV